MHDILHLEYAFIFAIVWTDAANCHAAETCQIDSDIDKTTRTIAGKWYLRRMATPIGAMSH